MGDIKDELSLENLAMPKGFYDPAALAQIKKPGEWRTHDEIVDSEPKYDTELKRVNEEIYNGSLYGALGLGYLKTRRAQLERLKYLFGLADDEACVGWISSHGCGDADTVEALVADALVTGKWEELPDEIQHLYHERKGAAT